MTDPVTGKSKDPSPFANAYVGTNVLQVFHAIDSESIWISFMQTKWDDCNVVAVKEGDLPDLKDGVHAGTCLDAFENPRIGSAGMSHRVYHVAQMEIVKTHWQ